MLSFERLPHVIAHRGASARAPENTLPAFTLAKELGATWVEFDVHLTKDLVPVVIHDDLLSNTTDGRGKVSDTNLDELLLLDAGKWFGTQFENVHIPTLKQVINHLVDLDLNANIELKCEKGQEKNLAEQVCRVMEEVWPVEKSAPLFSSFSVDTLRIFRASSESALIGLLFNVWRADWCKVADELGAVSVHLNYHVLSRARVAEIHATGRKALAFTVDSKRRAITMREWGVDSVFTNYPDIILSLDGYA